VSSDHCHMRCRVGYTSTHSHQYQLYSRQPGLPTASGPLCNHQQRMLRATKRAVPCLRSLLGTACSIVIMLLNGRGMIPVLKMAGGAVGAIGTGGPPARTGSAPGFPEGTRHI